MAFINSAQNFKPDLFRLTEFRIKLVMKYMIHCYLAMVKDGRKFDYAKKGKLKKECFLRNEFVDNYLSQKSHKQFYKDHISDTANIEIYFQKEENQPYQMNGEFADDYIDISIKETKLSDILSGETGDEIKFAVECKRIGKAYDYKAYIQDIQKFANRPFTTYRLPYEGQIGFVENSKLNHRTVSGAVNSILKATPNITTTQYLNELKLHDNFDGGYFSEHKRNHGEKQGFQIFHLLLDYSQIVVS